MELVNLVQDKKKAGLLCLPNSDCFSDAVVQAPSNEENEAPQDAASSDTNGPVTPTPPKFTGQLVLMQLPKGIIMEDIASGGCHFLAPKTEVSNENHTTSSTSGNHTRQAALVVPSKKQAFSVSRLETSNSLVLVPPLNSSATEECNNELNNANDESINNRTETGPASKKAKVSSTPSLVPVPARLLTPGGSGASFLELRPKLLRPGDLAERLQKHVFDLYHRSSKSTGLVNPYSNNSHATTDTPNSSKTKKTPLGRTISSLARELQSSPGQVEEALAFLQSFPMPPSSQDDPQNDTVYYGTLSEEVLQEAQNAVIATLAESDDFGDYAGKGVPVDDFVAQVLQRMSIEQTASSPMEVEHVIRYTLTLFLPKTDNATGYNPIANLTGTKPLDVTKIAKYLAHRLFQSQKKPWDESRFCSRWQGEMPGVGKRYQISLKMLRGIAIRMIPSSTPRKSSSCSPGDKNAEEPLWKYLPAEKLPYHPEERLQAVFANRDQWSLDDLAPYLESLVIETGLTQAEILLQYTTSVQSTTLGEDGKTFKLYSLKR